MPTRRSILSLFAAAPIIGLSTRAALASEPETFQSGGIAINGADPVAYHTEARPVTGDAAHVAQWNGATWRFASAGNRDAFVADPVAYAPRFGGYCAFAASRGYLAPTIPEAWTVYDGVLYLNANLRARDLWLAELPTVIAAGEANWPAILG